MSAPSPSAPPSSASSAPPDIVRTAYAELVVTDLARARAFWVDLLGFVVSAEDADALYLRGYEELVHHSLILRRGPATACGRIGFRVRSPEDLDRAEAWYAARGCPVRRMPAGTTPGLGEAVRAQDPLGFTVELVHEMAKVERLIQRYDVRRGASISRIDHVNIAIPDVPAAYAYYTDLGLRPVRDDRGCRRDALRGVDVPQADRARRGLHARGRAEAPPPRRSRCPSPTTS